MPDQESYTAIRVRQSDAERFRRFVRQLAAAADREVTQTEALGAVASYALDHLGDIAARLPGADAGGAALSDPSQLATVGSE